MERSLVRRSPPPASRRVHRPRRRRTEAGLWTALALFGLGWASALGAQEGGSGSVPPLFAALEGEWIGTGTLLGRPGAFTMRWEVGEGSFVRLTFSNAWITDEGSRSPVLASHAIYLPRGASAIGVWLDDRPQRITLEATLTDSTLTTQWTAESEEGRTEYRIRSPDEVVVRDVVYVEGSERLFAEATYRRGPPL